MRARRAIAAALGIILAAAGGVGATSAREDAAARGAAYLESRQQADGGFFSPAHPADAVAEALVALVAGDRDGSSVGRALGYLRSAGPARAEEKPAYAGRITAGLAAAGEDPRTFGGVDYVSRITRSYDPASGAYDSNLYANAVAVLGLIAASEPIPDRALTYLRVNQCPDGGFSWREGCLGPPDVDTTAVVTSILLAADADPSDAAVARARLFVQRAQNDEGGFGHEPGKPSNANSTGLSLSLLAALGEDPGADPWRRHGGATPVDALLALQTTAGGFRYTAGDATAGDYATVQAVPGLAGYALPVVAGTPATGPAQSAQVSQATRRSEAVRTPPSPRAASAAVPEAQEPAGGNRAGVIVEGGDERRRMCVLFDEPEITGDELLRRTGLDLETADTQLGTQICRIDGVGCPRGDCACRYPTFWGYWTRDGDDPWSFSDVGAADRIVRDGSVDGWVWGQDGEPAPPEETLDEVCAAAAAEATPVPDEPDEGPAEDDPAVSRQAMTTLALAAALLAAAAGFLLLRRRSRAP